MEILALILFNVALYYKSTKNFLIVDDMKWYEILQRDGCGWFIKDGIKGFFLCLRHRLYGGATFLHEIDCKYCQDFKEGETCKICKGKKRIHASSVRLDHWCRIILHTSFCRCVTLFL